MIVQRDTRDIREKEAYSCEQQYIFPPWAFVGWRGIDVLVKIQLVFSSQQAFCEERKANGEGMSEDPDDYLSIICEEISSYP